MCKLQSLQRSSNIRVLQSHSDDKYDNVIGSTEIRVSGEPSSACLWAMVNDFLEVDTSAACGDLMASRAGAVCGANSREASLKRAIQEIESIFAESTEQDVEEAKIISCVVKAFKSKRNVVGADSVHSQQALPGVLEHLQREGYNAGLCVTARKPDNATGLPPTGGYQYIDVILEEKPVLGTPAGKIPSEKLIVDLGFPAHFEIARPLPAYQKLTAILPSTFVGNSALLQKVVRIMSQAAKASLESQGMSIPPWRSFSFLLAKWLSSSCSRITSVDKAKHIILNSSSTYHVKPRVLAELNYNSTDLANLTDSPVNDESCENGARPFFLTEDAAKAWYSPPPTNQNPLHYDHDDSYTKKRSQANVVSALALVFAETQHTHMYVAAASQRNNRP